jgi:ribosome-binding factor A
MSRRTEQVESLVGQLVGEIFSRSLEFPDGTLATISRVHVPTDLKTATIYVSVLPFSESEHVLGYLIRNRKRIQSEMVKEMVMRSTPKIIFELDTLPEHASKIDEIIESEKNEP